MNNTDENVVAEEGAEMNTPATDANEEEGTGTDATDTDADATEEVA